MYFFNIRIKCTNMRLFLSMTTYDAMVILNYTKNVEQ